MTTNPLLTAASGLALFLIGANLAFLTSAAVGLMPWFRLKISSVTVLLVYVTLSFAYGNPSPWRAVLGMAAVLLDFVALAWTWKSIDDAKADGVTGYVPLLAAEFAHGDAAEENPEDAARRLP